MLGKKNRDHKGTRKLVSRQRSKTPVDLEGVRKERKRQTRGLGNFIPRRDRKVSWGPDLVLITTPCKLH